MPDVYLGSHVVLMVGATAASVLAYLEEVDYQESWEMWRGLGGKYEGGDPHGILLTTYLNAACDAFAGKEGVMPNGAIIVKESYTPEGDLAANTVMYKNSGHNLLLFYDYVSS